MTEAGVGGRGRGTWMKTEGKKRGRKREERRWRRAEGEGRWRN